MAGKNQDESLEIVIARIDERVKTLIDNGESSKKEDAIMKKDINNLKVHSHNPYDCPSRNEADKQLNRDRIITWIVVAIIGVATTIINFVKG